MELVRIALSVAPVDHHPVVTVDGAVEGDDVDLGGVDCPAAVGAGTGSGIARGYTSSWNEQTLRGGLACIRRRG
jgi:hypothetical protein